MVHGRIRGLDLGLEDKGVMRQLLQDLPHGQIIPQQGAVPIKRGNELIGAIGVSGASRRRRGRPRRPDGALGSSLSAHSGRVPAVGAPQSRQRAP
jgi:hypothetical protein